MYLLDESTWEGVCRTGREQSPIDLNPLFRLPYPTRFYLNQHYYHESNHRFFAQNNGHTGKLILKFLLRDNQA